MANPNKRFRGCKQNPKITQKTPGSFTEYVLGFCENQAEQRTIECNICGQSAICTEAYMDGDRVIGTFECIKCGSERDMAVHMHVLKAMYDRLQQNEEVGTMKTPGTPFNFERVIRKFVKIDCPECSYFRGAQNEHGIIKCCMCGEVITQ